MKLPERFPLLVALAVALNVAVVARAAVWLYLHPPSDAARIAVVAAIVLLADLPLAIGLIRYSRVVQQRRKQELEEYLSKPELRRPYELHMQSKRKAELAASVDVFSAIATALGTWGLAITQTPLLQRLQEPPLAMHPDEAFKVSMLPFSLVAFAFMFVVVPKTFGTTPGLRITRLVALDPKTGRPLPPSRVRSPHPRTDHRGGVPAILYVPEDQVTR